MSGSISVLSVSETGVGAFAVFPANETFSSSSQVGSGVGASVTASSASSSSYAPANASVSDSQTISAAWTGNLTGTATFSDTWTATNVANATSEANLNFGLSPVGPGYSNATFNFSLATAGTFSINWNATETGTNLFGLQNMVVSVDGGPMMQTSPVNAFAATPTGTFTGTLAAGAHTIVIEDNSNVTGAPTGTGSLLETLNLTVTPTGTIVAPPPVITTTYGGAALNLTGTEGATLGASIATFTDSNTADTASQLSAVINWGDGTTSAGTLTGANGTFAVTSAGHSYADEGTFATSIAVTNSVDGKTTTLTGSAITTEADVLTAGSLPAINLVTGNMFSGTVADFTDTYTANTASDFSATIKWGDGTSSIGTISDVNGTISVTGSHSYTNAGTDAISTVLTDTHGTASATASATAIVIAPTISNPGTITNPGTGTSAGGNTYTLTTGEDNIQGVGTGNIVIATSNTLSDGDVINAGTGSNSLQLSGGGTFNLGIPDTLKGVTTVTAQEGAGGAAQVVTLREGTTLAVNVLSATSSPSTAGITIYGAENHDTITLGAGQDVVYLGQGETLVGGSGVATVHINQDTANASISGGTGTINLVVDGGGDVTLGAAITKANSVSLSKTTHFTANNLAGLQITGSAAGHDVITIQNATQSVIGGGANETIKASAAAAGASISGLGANSTLEITSAGNVTLNAATSVTQVKMDAAGSLQLNNMQFISATATQTGSTITAGAANQTLISTHGGDVLVGAAAGLDIFKGTAAGLSNDIISSFNNLDKIDISNLAFAGATIQTKIFGGYTDVTLISGKIKTQFALAGAFSNAGFNLTSDGAGGTLLTHS